MGDENENSIIFAEDTLEDFLSNNLVLIDNISLALDCVGNPNSIPIKQNDDRSRMLCIKLLHNRSCYQIPSGCNAYIKLRKPKPDGHAVIEDCAIRDNRVYMLYSKKMLTVSGDAESEIILTLDGRVLTSATFTTKIIKTVSEDENIDYKDELISLFRILDEMDAATADTRLVTESANNAIVDVYNAISDITTAGGELYQAIEDAIKQKEDFNEYNQFIASSKEELNVLFENVSNSKSALDKSITNAGELGTNLNNIINKFICEHNNLSGLIEDAEDIAAYVEQRIESAEKAKTKLDSVIENASSCITDLEQLISNANDVHVQLESNIKTGGNLKEQLTLLLSSTANLIQNINTAANEALVRNSELDDSIKTAQVSITNLDNSIAEAEEKYSEAQGIVAKADQIVGDFTTASEMVEAGLDKMETELQEASVKINKHTESADIHTSKSDKEKLANIEANANKYTHPDSGATPGTYRSVQVDKQGHVTGGSNPVLAVAEGGTGATDAATARGNLGAASSDEVNKHTEASTIHATPGTNIPLITGTQTGVTGNWTGVADGVTELKDGMMINYYLPFGGSGNATLNLTLSDGSETGAVACYHRDASRLTTHVVQYGIAQLVYRENGQGSVTTPGWWMIYDYYASPTSVLFNNNVKLEQPLYRYKLVMQAIDDGWYPLFPDDKTSAAVLSSYNPSEMEFLIDSSILYYGAATTVNAGDTTSALYLTALLDIRYNLNVSAITQYAPLYLKGKIGSSGGFVLDSVDYYAQQLPATEDGYYYMYIGYAYSTSGVRLDITHPVYYFKNGKINIYTGVEQEVERLETEVATLTTDLAELTDSAIKEIVEGTHLHITDSSNARFPEVSVFGQTTQGSTAGASIAELSAEATSFGLTWKINSNGELSVTGTTAGNTANRSNVIINITRYLVAGQTYTLKLYDASSLFMCRLSHTIDGTAYDTAFGQSATLTFTSDMTSVRVQFVYNTYTEGVTVNETGKAMVAKGATAPDKWEPYTGGQASPNPQYKQDFTNVGDSGGLDLVSQVGGRNLLQNSTFNFNNWNISPSRGKVLSPETDKPNSSIFQIECASTIAPDNTPLYNPIRMYLEPKIGDTITFSFDYFCEDISAYGQTGGICTFRLFDGQTGGNYITNNVNPTLSHCGITESNKWVRGKYTYTFTSTTAVAGWYAFGLYFSNSTIGRTVRAKYREIKVGSDTLWTPAPEDITDSNREEYRKYISHVPIPLPKPLRGLKVTNGGNYTDAGGQQWIADYFDMENTHRKVKEFVLDGSETWDIQSINANGYVNFRHYNNYKTDSENNKQFSISTHFRYDLSTIANVTQEGFHTSPMSGVMFLRIHQSKFATVDELKARLAANPVTVLIPGTETTEPLPAETQAQLRALRSYYRNTHVYNSENAWMKVTYFPDLKTWINNKIGAVSNAILQQTGGAL